MDGAAKRRAIDAKLAEWDATVPVLTGPSYDDAIMGLARWGSLYVVVYDTETVIGLISADIRSDEPDQSDEATEDDARSHFEFNVLGSTFEGSPVFFEPVEEWWDPEWKGEVLADEVTV